MSFQATALKYDAIRSLDTATLSGAYLPISTALTYPAIILKIVNNSTVDLLISTDGTTNMDIVPKNGFALYDAGTNRGNPSPGMAFPVHTQFYASGSMGVGLVYVVCLTRQPNPQIPLP